MDYLHILALQGSTHQLLGQVLHWYLSQKHRVKLIPRFGKTNLFLIDKDYEDFLPFIIVWSMPVSSDYQNTSSLRKPGLLIWMAVLTSVS